MKFGKHLESRQLELPEYNGHFINYKQLKKLIKQLVADVSMLDSQSTAIIEKTLQENKSSFFFRVERELEKVNSFYLEKEAELRVRLDILSNKKNDAINKNRVGSKQSIAYLTLYDGFKRFSRDLDRLEQFVELNQTGFSKVLKKWDKRSKSHTKELYLSKAVSVQPVFNRGEISQLNDLCANSIVELDAKVEGEEIVRFETNRNQSISGINSLNLANSNSVAHPSQSDNLLLTDDFEIDELYSELLQICFSSNASDLLTLFIKRIKTSLNSSYKLTKLFFLSVSTKISDEILKQFYQESLNLITLGYKDEISQRTIIHESCCNTNESRDFILKLAIEKNTPINLKDTSGRLPLHYASELGKTSSIEILSAVPETVEQINTLDYDSMSPLLLSISSNHLETVEILLKLGSNPSPESTEQNPQYLPLNVACTKGHYDIVKLLLSYPDVSKYQKDAEGLLPMHLVAKNGNHDLVPLLTAHDADPNQVDSFNKWTPIFYAVSEGHVETTKALLENGAKFNLKDEDNLTPLFYASWEGHVDALNILIQAVHNQNQSVDVLSPIKQANKNQNLEVPPLSSLNPEIMNFESIPDFSLPPPIIPLRRYGHNFLEKKIFVQLKFDLDRNSLALNENLNSALPGRIVISSRTSDVVPRNILFPIDDSTNIVAFQVDSLNAFQIDFEVFPSFGTKLIAKTSALSDVFTEVSNDGLNNNIKLPLFDARLKTVGELNFQFQVIHPYSGTPLEISKYDTYWKSTSGNNTSSSTTTAALNNTLSIQNVLSFVTASSLSGDYMKINVTLLSDGTPIVCPSWNLEILGTTIPIFQFSLEQLKALTSYDFETVDIYNQSLTKHQYLTGLQKLLSSNFIPFDDFLKTLPDFVNLDIEVLYPTEAEISQLPITLPESTNLNEFIDLLLTSTFNHVRSIRNNNISKSTRSLLFSSSNQSVVSILNWKQPNYPVFFDMSGIHFNESLDQFEKCSTNGYSSSVVTKEDRKTRSLKEATKFAVLNNLLGIIVPSELLVLVPDLVETIRSRGLVLVASKKGEHLFQDQLNETQPLHNNPGNDPNGANGVRYRDVLSFKDDIDM